MLALGCLRASGLLHNNMLKRIMRAPMSFFDTTPLGRIVNRFSRDVDVMDNSFPGNLGAFLTYLFQVEFLNHNSTYFWSSFGADS